jgi:hypothetical protein
MLLREGDAATAVATFVVGREVVGQFGEDLGDRESAARAAAEDLDDLLGDPDGTVARVRLRSLVAAGVVGE